MHRQRGFSLVEVLAGLLIISFVLITSLAVFFERQRRLKQADDQVVAYQALANEAEVVRLESFSTLAPGEKQPFSSDTAILESLDHASTERSIVETKPGVRLVELSITWNKGKNSARLTVARVATGAGGSFW